MDSRRSRLLSFQSTSIKLRMLRTKTSWRMSSPALTIVTCSSTLVVTKETRTGMALLLNT